MGTRLEIFILVRNIRSGVRQVAMIFFPPVYSESNLLTRDSEHLGVATDLLVYSIIIPVVPFRLEHLGYSNVSVLMGWLLFAYVSVIFKCLD